jgi:hypothetical protein
VRDIACFWRDGVKTDLPAGAYDARACSLCVVGGSVYVAGYSDQSWPAAALCWINGTVSTIDLGGCCLLNSICEGPPSAADM